MNVLFTIKGNEPYVSQQAQIELIAGLREQGISVYLMGWISDEVKNEVEKLNIPFVALYPKNKIDKEYIAYLKNFVIKNSIDIVHFLDGTSIRNGIIALNKTNIKLIVYYGSLSLHWHDPSAYLSYLHPRIDKIICNSEHVYVHVKKQLLGKNKSKAVKVYKGYNPSWFSQEKAKDLTEFSIPKNAIVVGFIGNHRKVKGTKYFIKSSHYLSSKKEIHYLVIGNRTNQNQFLAMAAKSPLGKNIHFLGKRNDAVSILKACDIYSQTSLSEGFGRAVSEAMSLGKPVVMTNAGGCTELIDENSGIVVPTKDPKSIGKAISMLADEDALRLSMGKHARQRIETVYHIDFTVKDTLKVYKQLLG